MVTSIVSDSVTLWTVACQASLSGRWVLQARILERMGQYWSPWPSIFPAALAANPPEYLVLPEPLRPKQRHHLRTWPHGADPSPAGQPQEQTPVDDPHAEVGIEPQLKPRGSVAKEEDPEPSHRLYKLQIKPQGQPGRRCVCGTYNRSLSAPIGENALVLMAVDTGGRDTQEDQIRL